MNKLTSSKLTAAAITLSIVSTFGVTSAASAIATPKTDSSVKASSQDGSAFVAAGDAKIAKRLTDLDALNAKLATTTKLSAANKSSLQSEVDDSKTGLSQLKVKLDADTTTASAKADDSSIVSDYRVYMVVAPKVRLTKVADDQLANEAKLLTFADLLQTKASASKDNTTLSPRVTALVKTITDNQSASMAIENTILAVKPTDYNADHSVLKTQAAKLKAIHTSNVAAHTEGKSIAQALGYKL